MARQAKKEPHDDASPAPDNDGDAVVPPSTPVAEGPRDGGGGVLARLAALHHGPNRERLAFMFVIGVACAVLFPFLGATGFFDPWESHYAEVARQMVQRDDYLYPFWKDAYFFSKPILLFWLTAPLYALIGAGHADRELPALVELCGRLPIALFALFLVVVVTLTVRRLASLRAAVFAGLVLSTSPFFAFVGRQAITDMLYVAPMSAAMCLLAIAFFDDEGREKMATARLPRWLLIAFGAALVPQLWEVGRSAQFLDRVAFLGSEAATRVAVSATLVGLAVAFLVVLGRVARDPLLHASAALLAIATLGKGPHAVALCGLPYFLYFVVSFEWRLLARPAMLTGALLYLAIASPWVVVMLLFKGKDEGQKTWFTRFVLYDLFGRLGGVHGERATFEYYVRYLAYGLFPWSPLFPIALLDAASARMKLKEERTARDRLVLFTAIWAISFFTFFTVTETKFHHYILPLVVPAAILVGLWLDRLLDASAPRLSAGIGLIAVLTVVVIARDLVTQPWQLVDLFTYHYVSYKPDYYFPGDVAWRVGIGAVGLVVALLVALGVVADALAGRRALWPSRAGSAVLAGGAPTTNGGFVGMALMAAIVSVLCAVHVYLANASQHWSHRWIMKTYWTMSNPGEPLLSYQMDWKGETFYAHNTDIQIKKSAADLKKAVEKPGRAFILVQQDRYNRLKSAVSAEHGELLRVADRSNAKWFLVLSEDPPPKAPKPAPPAEATPAPTE